MDLHLARIVRQGHIHCKRLLDAPRAQTTLFRAQVPHPPWNHVRNAQNFLIRLLRVFRYEIVCAYQGNICQTFLRKHLPASPVVSAILVNQFTSSAVPAVYRVRARKITRSMQARVLSLQIAANPLTSSISTSMRTRTKNSVLNGQLIGTISSHLYPGLATCVDYAKHCMCLSRKLGP